MFEMFLNPWSMAAGGILISSPVIIHLINRMRFRRVRWAAMEFLLKSQKRNRRRLIIEQLILLLLRILLVLLAGLLLARFVGFAFAFMQPQNTLHVVVIDDTASMADRWRETDQARDSFALARDVIVPRPDTSGGQPVIRLNESAIATDLLKANSAQTLHILRLSDPEAGRRFERIGRNDLTAIRNHLDDLTCTALHTDLLRGVEQAERVFDQGPQDRPVLHVLSDFRQRDWGGPEAEALGKALGRLAQARKAQVNLVDVAHPYRGEGQRLPVYHDNLAVVELRPESRVAARYLPLQFNVTVANFSASERQNVRVTVKVNGGERAEGSLTIPTVPPGHTAAAFLVSFDQLGTNQVTANLEDEGSGLQIDNTRYAVVEVREQVPVLVIDGDPSRGREPGGDTFHVQALFDRVRGAAKGYELVLGGVQELERPNLDRFPTIYLLNVRELTEKAQAGLEQYARDGGGVAFFLGERVNPDFYTKKLYAGGKGLFPAPLADRPYPPAAEEELKPDLLADQFQLFLRSEAHPVFAAVYDYRSVFKYLAVRRYFPVPRLKWDPEPGRVEELATLPNRRSVEDYRESAQALLAGLPLDDPTYEKYRPGLARHQRAVRDTLAGQSPYPLAEALDALLTDAGDAKDPERPNLAEFWQLPENAALRGRVERFRETVRYGDPLVIAGRYGKGRVVAFLTTAGQAWNNWAGGVPVSASYPVVMLELQKYLSSAGGEANLAVGAPLEIQLDATRFDPGTRLRRFYVPEAREADGKAGGLVDLRDQLGAAAGGRLTYVFDEARRPGVYLFEVTPRAEDGGADAKPRLEQRAYAFNVDPVEGDLRRAPREELERVPGVRLRSPATNWTGELANRTSDLSESPWLYLTFLLILLAEQALAVRLSHHLKGGEAAPPVPAGRPA